MAQKTLSAVRALCQQILQSEFQAGTALVWEPDELDLYIGECLIEISETKPYEVKETLTTTASSKDIDISSITDLLEVDKVEFRVDKNPRQFRNCSIFGDTLTMDVGFLPLADETVYLFCHKVHQLSDSTSTLNPALERLLTIGVTAQAAIAKAQKYIDKVNIGGVTTPTQMHAWGINRLAIYQREVRRIAKVKSNIQYPRD